MGLVSERSIFIRQPLAAAFGECNAVDIEEIRTRPVGRPNDLLAMNTIGKGQKVVQIGTKSEKVCAANRK